MKNICYSGAILALTTLLLTGCEALQKEYMKITLRKQDKVLTFGREAGLEKSVTFSSTTSWTASVQGDWLAVAPDSGNSGSNTITVTTLTANDGNDGRTTEITLTAGGDPATITVVQKGTESTDDPDPNNPDPDEPVASDEKFITKIRLTGTEDPNDVSDFYIAYDENGNIVGTDRFDIDMEAMGIDVVLVTDNELESLFACDTIAQSMLRVLGKRNRTCVRNARDRKLKLRRQLGLPLEPRRTFEAVGSPSHFGEE